MRSTNTTTQATFAATSARTTHWHVVRGEYTEIQILSLIYPCVNFGIDCCTPIQRLTIFRPRLYTFHVDCLTAITILQVCISACLLMVTQQTIIINSPALNEIA